jgi:hypothetical protein
MEGVAMSSPLTNAFDELGTGFDPIAEAKAKREQEANHNKIDYLIHQVFKQNEAGAELLAIWVQNALIMSPTAKPGDDLLAIGLEEGKKEFIRKVILTINKVEGDTNE